MDHPNLTYVQELAGDDAVFKAKLISVIKTEFPKERAAYAECLASGNFTQTAEAVHKLKNKIGMLSMEASYGLAQEYEEELKKNLTSKQEAFGQVLDQMDNFINNL